MNEILAFLFGAIVLVIGSRHDVGAQAQRDAEDRWYQDPLPLRPYDYEADGL